MSKIGIAVIGCGDIARARYFPAIAGSPEFELVGVQSIDVVREIRPTDLGAPREQQFGADVVDLDSGAHEPQRLGDQDAA